MCGVAGMHSGSVALKARLDGNACICIESGTHEEKSVHHAGQKINAQRARARPSLKAITSTSRMKAYGYVISVKRHCNAFIC